MYSIRSKISESYLGYPNLSRPNDHFEVTPFEAIFCGPEIQPHIRMNEAPFEYVDSLKQFVLNEVEPWYLDLQNIRIGAQARSDYRYYSFRRAKHRIIVGEDVTPTTDKGEYIVEPNGKLALHAGDAIILKPGVHFKAGYIVHIAIEYNRCKNFGNKSMNDDESDGNTQNSEEIMVEKRNVSKVEVKLYPNPVTEELTIVSNSDVKISHVSIYDLKGVLRLHKETNQNTIKIRTNSLVNGIYIVRINAEGQVFTRKLVVL